MITLLQINASINNGNGESSRLANHFVAAFRKTPTRQRPSWCATSLRPSKCRT